MKPTAPVLDGACRAYTDLRAGERIKAHSSSALLPANGKAPTTSQEEMPTGHRTGTLIIRSCQSGLKSLDRGLQPAS